MGRPRVSVITIFWRARGFLAEAIASVRNQTWRDWELILVDDGSDDGSLDIARTAAREESDRIRIVRHWTGRNRGMSRARNLGVSRASGEVVTFLDADDVWLPGNLEFQLARLDAHPGLEALCAPAEWWFSWTGNEADRARDFVQRWRLPLDSVARPPELLRMVLHDEWSSLCNVFVRRDLFTALGGYESAFRGMYEDQAFHAKLCLSHPVLVSSHCTYRYRQHPDSCTRRSHESGATSAARIRYFDWLRRYLAKAGRDFPELQESLSQLGAPER
ncbi:MAG: glycosyltransferase [Thermoanaerobaculia bacterium]